MKKTTFSRESKKLAALLTKLRVDSGLTQIELAKKLRAPQSFVSKYETGERRLDILELRTIVQALGSTLSDFIKLFERVLHEA